MRAKRILVPQRLRSITGGFAFIPHRFLTDGFCASLEREELLLYFLLVLVSDRHGLSFYGYDAICSLLKISLEEYIAARNGLIEKDLLAFDGRVFQVLALPEKAPEHGDRWQDSARIRQLIEESLSGGAL
jgi:hypothetical protein